MSFLARLTFYFFSNLIALSLADFLVKGFEISPGFNNFLWVAAILTLINIFLKPIVKLILTPVIIITFGLGIFLVNILMLYFLDKILISIAIAGLKPLVYATIIISLANLIINLAAKRVYKK